MDYLPAAVVERLITEPIPLADSADALRLASLFGTAGTERVVLLDVGLLELREVAAA